MCYGNPASSAISQEAVCAQRYGNIVPVAYLDAEEGRTSHSDNRNRMSLNTDVASDYARVRAKLALPECV